MLKNRKIDAVTRGRKLSCQMETANAHNQQAVAVSRLPYRKVEAHHFPGTVLKFGGEDSQLVSGSAPAGCP